MKTLNELQNVFNGYVDQKRVGKAVPMLLHNKKRTDFCTLANLQKGEELAMEQNQIYFMIELLIHFQQVEGFLTLSRLNNQYQKICEQPDPNDINKAKPLYESLSYLLRKFQHIEGFVSIDRLNKVIKGLIQEKFMHETLTLLKNFKTYPNFITKDLILEVDKFVVNEYKTDLRETFKEFYQ